MKKILAILAFVLVGTMTYAQWGVNGTMTYWNNGNVGIGTSTPTQSLHIYNAVKANILGESNYSGTPASTQTLSNINLKSIPYNQGFQVTFRRNSGGFNEMLQSCQLTSVLYAEFMYFRYDTQKWQMKNGVKEAEFQNAGNFLINSTGQIGIGVTAAADFKAGVKFQVTGDSYLAGRVRCHEVEVALAPTFVWPDYVFNTGYNLKPLYEVESFVMANKHLPGVPSQSEITNSGVKLGEMNATLLQKVEELTLYMINLQKENDALKVRVSNLEK